MKRTTFLFATIAVMASMASCNNSEMQSQPKLDGGEIAVMNGVKTKGYVDGTTFYEKATATMHTSTESTPRKMRMSAYRTPEAGQTSAAGNYFVDMEFAKGDGDIWRHTPAYYWPLASTLDFLAYSSTEPFAAKDAKWDATNASSKIVLTFNRARCQDDVLYAAQTMKSSDATDGSYNTGQPVNMEFKHAQAWVEFQLSVASEEMKDKIAIKEIVLEDAYDNGVFTITRGIEEGNTVANGVWSTGVSDNIIFDDTYKVYGHSKMTTEYEEENELVKEKEEALETAKLTGNADAITAAELELKAAQDALAEAIAQYPVVNPLNAVGAMNDVESTPSVASEVKTDCAFLDMLLPQQPKANIIIKYVLAGRPNVLEYKYTIKKAGANWEAGKKYIYDIDFVISEITVAPTVKAYEATFDGTDLTPVEIF